MIFETRQKNKTPACGQSYFITLLSNELKGKYSIFFHNMTKVTFSIN